MTKLQKNIDKTQSTPEIEEKILAFKNFRYQNLKQNNEHENYFVLIDITEVKENSISKVDEWLQILGDSLKMIANKELKSIKNDIDNYEKALGGEMGAIDQLKALLNVITEIKNTSMDMEFRIVEVQEQFRVLDMYEYEIDEEVKKDVEGLMNQWDQLLEYADKTNFGVNDFKKNFAEVTKQDVETFKIKIIDEYTEYVARGPGVSAITLEEGVELLNQSKEKIKAFNKTREENVLAEKLFNLPISKFPELI
jgi:dynein heavy chain